MKRSEANTLRYTLTLVAAVLTGVGLAAAVNAVSADDDRSTSDLNAEFHHEFDLAPGGLVRIRNASGRIVVGSGNAGRVRLTVTKRVTFHERRDGWSALWFQRGVELDQAGHDAIEALEPEIRTAPDTIEITSLQSPPRNNVTVAYHYDVVVPRNTRLSVATANGPVRISGVHGAVSAASENGDVHCDAIRGNLAARARNGGVYLRHIDGALRAEAMNGPILVDSRGVSRMQALEANSENGPVRVRLPREAAFYLRASAINGHVDTGFRVDGAPAGGRGHFVEGPVGPGGPQVSLNAFNGSVYLNTS